MLLLGTLQLVIECPYQILLLYPYLLALLKRFLHLRHLLHLLAFNTILPGGYLTLLSHLVFPHHPLVVLHLLLELDSVPSLLLVLPPLLP